MSGLVVPSRLLAGLAPSNVEVVLGQAVERQFRAHEVVTHEGEPANELLLITRGRARFFSIGPAGQKMLLLWLRPGEIIGGAALEGEPSRYAVSTETVEETSVLVWTRHAMRALADRYPMIVQNGISIAADYLRWYVAAHAALSCNTARQRLGSVLKSLVPLVGRRVPGGVELDVTNEELASAAHVTPFTASRLLNEWGRQRLVVKRRGKVVLLAPERVSMLAK
jgi:CRP-like cAMP-binding protein